MTNRYLEKIASTKTSDAVVGGAAGVGGELIMRKYAPHMAAGLGHAGLAISGVVGAGVQMGIGAAQRHFQEKKAVEMPLEDLIKEHKDLVGVLKSNNRAGELKELKEQGAELSKLEKLAMAFPEGLGQWLPKETMPAYKGGIRRGNPKVRAEVKAQVHKDGFEPGSMQTSIEIRRRLKEMGAI